MSEETKEPSPKLTHISTDMCEYDNEDTEKEDLNMKTDHHEEYQYQDTEMILEDHCDRKDDLHFMNCTKKRHPRKAIPQIIITAIPRIIITQKKTTVPNPRRTDNGNK